MAHALHSWPKLFPSLKSEQGKNDAALAQEDADTQTVIGHYLLLADQALAGKDSDKQPSDAA